MMNNLKLILLGTGQNINHMLTRGMTHRLKAPRLREHANLSAPCYAEARSRGIALHVSSNHP